MTIEEIKIERYKRHNEKENEVLKAIIYTFNPTIFDKDNTETIVQRRIKQTKGPTVFLDAVNGNLTATGKNYRKTEIRFMNIFTEVKHQNSISNIQDSVLGEISRAENIKGKYWLVLLGDAYRKPIVLCEFVKMIKKYELENKVRIFLTIEDYILALQDEIL
jgi:hypothetical protein